MEALETLIENHAKKVIDLVCGMEVEPSQSKLISIYQGKSYWFCAESCRKAFESDPAKYLESKSLKKRGWFGRYLDRMAQANKKEFGCQGPRCH